MNDAKFQFKGFKIVRSLIEQNDIEPSKEISLGFDPKGLVNKERANFQLNLGVKVEDKNKAFNIEIQAVAHYSFNNEISLNKLNNYFYTNAPALLFPYIRAYISTITNLSGLNPINLPTLNLISLGANLKENTKEV